MELFVRLVRALWVFGVIFVSYMLQLGLTQLLGTSERDPATGRDELRVPATGPFRLRRSWRRH